MKTYILIGEFGEYSNHCVFPLGAFESVEAADLAIAANPEEFQSAEDAELFEAEIGKTDGPKRVRAYSTWNEKERKRNRPLSPVERLR